MQSVPNSQYQNEKSRKQISTYEFYFALNNDHQRFCYLKEGLGHVHEDICDIHNNILCL